MSVGQRRIVAVQVVALVVVEELRAAIEAQAVAFAATREARSWRARRWGEDDVGLGLRQEAADEPRNFGLVEPRLRYRTRELALQRCVDAPGSDRRAELGIGVPPFDDD